MESVWYKHLVSSNPYDPILPPRFVLCVAANSFSPHKQQTNKSTLTIMSSKNLTINSFLTLSNGIKMPLLGLGTYKAIDTIENAIKAAYDAGYRHIDTAAFYQNEKQIGEAIRNLGIPRDQLFITSKLWYTEHGYEKTIAACNQTLKLLGMDYVDLYLVHWPGTQEDGPRNPIIRRDTWRAMEQLYNEGKCKAIGVSNYTVSHLKEMIEEGSKYKVNIFPMVNQFELHPKLTQKELIQYCKSHNIIVESYSPFGKGKLISNPELSQLATKYKVSVAQLIIRWLLQQDIVAIPKSDKPNRIVDNANVYHFEISEEDMKQIDALNEDWHCTWNPYTIE